jgi:hypothetical protein
MTTTATPISSPSVAAGAYHPRRRTWWLAANTVVALSAIAISVVAINHSTSTTNASTPATHTPPTAAPRVAVAPSAATGDAADRRAAQLLPAGWPARQAIEHSSSAHGLTPTATATRPAGAVTGHAVTDCIARRLPTQVC